MVERIRLRRLALDPTIERVQARASGAVDGAGDTYADQAKQAAADAAENVGD